MAVKKKLTPRQRRLAGVISEARDAAEKRKNQKKLPRAPLIQSAAASEAARRRSLGGLPPPGGSVKIDMELLKRGTSAGQIQQAKGGKKKKAGKAIKAVAKVFGG